MEETAEEVTFAMNALIAQHNLWKRDAETIMWTMANEGDFLRGMNRWMGRISPSLNGFGAIQSPEGQKIIEFLGNAMTPHGWANARPLTRLSYLQRAMTQHSTPIAFQWCIMMLHRQSWNGAHPTRQTTLGEWAQTTTQMTSEEAWI